jgi:hypothetical protein
LIYTRNKLFCFLLQLLFVHEQCKNKKEKKVKEKPQCILSETSPAIIVEGTRSQGTPLSI